MIDNKFFPIMGSGFNMALANFVWDKKISAKEFSHKLLHEISYDGELEIVENHYKSDDDSKIEVFFRVKDSNGFPNYYKVIINKGDYCYISNLFINVYDGTEYKMADMRDTYSNEESYIEFLKLMMLKNIDDKKRSFENMNDYINIRPVSLNNASLDNEYKAFFSSLFK